MSDSDEWAGKLMPGAQEALAAKLESWRASGFVTHIEILGAEDCEAAEEVEGLLYPLDRPPSLPLPGCTRSPCCACDYLPVLDDEGGAEAKALGRS